MPMTSYSVQPHRQDEWRELFESELGKSFFIETKNRDGGPRRKTLKRIESGEKISLGTIRVTHEVFSEIDTSFKERFPEYYHFFVYFFDDSDLKTPSFLKEIESHGEEESGHSTADAVSPTLLRIAELEIARAEELKEALAMRTKKHHRLRMIFGAFAVVVLISGYYAAKEPKRSIGAIHIHEVTPSDIDTLAARILRGQTFKSRDGNRMRPHAWVAEYFFEGRELLPNHPNRFEVMELAYQLRDAYRSHFESVSIDHIGREEDPRYRDIMRLYRGSPTMKNIIEEDSALGEHLDAEIAAYNRFWNGR